MRSLNLLGTPTVESSDDTAVPRFRSQRTAALLGYLAAERRTITRERLAAFFWPDDPSAKGKGNLRRELHNLVQILPGCWEIDRVQVRFSPLPATTVDLDIVRELENSEAWQEAGNLLRGEFLEGIAIDDNLEFETWLLGEQERWRQRAERILMRAVEALERQGGYRRALRHARKLLHIMPWSEETQRLVMRLLALSGQRSAALKQFELCKRALWDELGVEPTAETFALYERIRQSPNFSKDNIPFETSPIIGREREMQSISAMLSEPQIRLITIAGVGGIGKTHLALAIAKRHTEGQFRDGVTYVPLVSLETQEQLVAAAARSVQLPLTLEDERAPRRQLLDYMKSKELLLILDNVEQLRDDGKEVISAILNAAAGVRIVTTSRRPLRLTGEHQFPLQGLDYAGETADHPAAKLFTYAAQRVSPGFAITGQNVHHLNQLCRMVDGMPLALELASGWINTLPLTAIIEEIEANHDILAAGEEQMPLRHSSLRAVFDGTWRQLRPETRQVYADLSIFRGSFTPEAAVHVANVSPRLLSELVSHSLLEFDPETERYQLHELLHHFAAEKLFAGDYERTHRRHLAYYMRLAEEMDNVDQRPEKFTLWEADFGNIEAALDWSLKDSESRADGLILASALEDFWLGSNGHAREGYLWLKSFAGSDFTSLSLPWQARFWRIVGRMENLLGQNIDLAFDHFLRSLEQYEKAGDDAGCAQTLYYIGDMFLDRNKKTEAEQYFNRALDLAFKSGALKTEAAALYGLSGIARSRGKLSDARAYSRKSMAIAMKIDDRERIAHLYAAMGMIAVEEQLWADGKSMLQDALERYQDIGLWGNVYVVLNALGEIARATEDYKDAEKYYLESLDLVREQEIAIDIAIGLFNLAQNELMLGDTRQALIHISEGYAQARPLGDEIIMLFLEANANLYASQGRPYDAALLWGSVEAVCETFNVHLDTADKLQREHFYAIARSKSEESRFQKAWLRGRHFSLEQAVEFAQHMISSN